MVLIRPLVPSMLWEFIIEFMAEVTNSSSAETLGLLIRNVRVLPKVVPNLSKKCGAIFHLLSGNIPLLKPIALSQQR
jgi:hypothetical protein